VFVTHTLKPAARCRFPFTAICRISDRDLSANNPPTREPSCDFPQPVAK